MFIKLKGGREEPAAEMGQETETDDNLIQPSNKAVEWNKDSGFPRTRGRVFFFVCLGFLVFSVLLSTAVFFLSVRGAEQVLVPDVTGRDLTSALLDLQSKELYPQIQLRYSGSIAEKGMILEQSPSPGTIVKAGRRIRLVISQGVRLTAVENFANRMLEDVRREIAQAADIDSSALITLDEPVLYRVSNAPAGTILEQNPAPGTALTGPTAITLVVSRGPESDTKEMPFVTGLSPSEAAARLSEREIGFVFTTKQAVADEKPFIVKEQDWPADTQIALTRTVALQVTTPASWDPSEICALFSYEIPRTPVPIAYTLTAISPQGERTVLISEVLTGGLFTCPYLLPAGTTLSLGVQGRELHRELIGMP
ncbi:MAG: PASTA domain-containing protein [Spirochaetaceae bacterium]|jgi:beta-lactam-binding protein with PASTA domain|nr:PASTA domain-containing protein [Spirochaetaceae bacterium]